MNISKIIYANKQDKRAYEELLFEYINLAFKKENVLSNVLELITGFVADSNRSLNDTKSVSTKYYNTIKEDIVNDLIKEDLWAKTEAIDLAISIANIDNGVIYYDIMIKITVPYLNETIHKRLSMSMLMRPDWGFNFYEYFGTSF